MLSEEQLEEISEDPNFIKIINEMKKEKRTLSKEKLDKIESIMRTDLDQIIKKYIGKVDSRKNHLKMGIEIFFLTEEYKSKGLI